MLKNNISVRLLMLLFCLMFTNSVFAAPNSFVYEGVLMDANGNAVGSGAVASKNFSIDLKISGTTVLTQTFTSVSVFEGNFKLTIDGLGVGSAYSGGYTSLQGIIAASGSKTLQVSVEGESFAAIDINSVPYAIEAGSLANNASISTSGNVETSGSFKAYKGAFSVEFKAPPTLSANTLFQFPDGNGSSGQVLKTDGNGVTSWSSVDIANVNMGTVSTTELGYLDNVTSSIQTQLDSKLSGTVALANGGTGATTASVALNNLLPSQVGNSGKFLTTDGAGVVSWGTAGGAPGDASYLAKGIVQFDTDAATSGISITGGVAKLSNTAVVANSYGSASQVGQFTVDAQGRITAASNMTINDSSKLPLAGGTMSGALNMGAFDITNIGNLNLTNQKNIKLGHYTDTEEATLSGGLIAGDEGRVWYNTEDDKIKFWNGSAVQELGVSGGGGTVTSVTSGNNYITLTSTTTTPIVTANVGTTADTLAAGNDSRITEALQKAGGTMTGGLTLSAGTAAAGTAPLYLQAGTNLTTPVSGALEFDGSNLFFTNNTPTRKALLSGTSSVLKSNDTYVVRDGSSNIFAAMGEFDQVTLKGATTGYVNLLAPASVTSYSLTFPNDDGDGGQVLTTNGSGLLTWAYPTTSPPLSALSDATADNTINNSNFQQTWNWNTLTSGTALSINAPGLTSGRIIEAYSGSTSMTGTIANFALTANSAGITGNIIKSTVSGNNSLAVPLWITNLGGGLSLRINDETGDGDATPFVVDSSGNVGIGTSSPAYKLHISGSSISEQTIGINNNPVVYIPTQGTGAGQFQGSIAFGNGLRSANNSASDQGRYNTAVGIGSSQTISTGAFNTSVGFNSLFSSNTGSYNSAFGFRAMQNSTTASGNTAMGSDALALNETGPNNSAFGVDALRAAINGSHNVGLGYNAGSSVSSGYYNSILGANAGNSIITGYSNVIMGYDADVQFPTTNNAIVLGVSSSADTHSLTIGNDINYNSTNSAIIGGQFNNFSIDEYGAGNASFNLRRADGSPSSPISVNTNSTYMRLNFMPYNGSIFNNGVQLEAATGSAITTSTFNIKTTTGGMPNSRIFIDQSGKVGVANMSPQTTLDVNGAIRSTETVIASGSSVDLSLGNSFVLQSVGGSSIALSNPVPGAHYTLVVSDGASRTYTFTGCTNKFSPANSATTGSTTTIYKIYYSMPGSTCYIDWKTGYN